MNSMMIDRLKEIHDKIDTTKPAAMALGGHNVCEEIRILKLHVKSTLDLIMQNAVATDTELKHICEQLREPPLGRVNS